MSRTPSTPPVGPAPCAADGTSTAPAAAGVSSAVQTVTVPRKRRERLPVWPVLLLWALLMAPLLRWGLPDRQRDDLLFGGGPAWDAAQYDVAPVLRARQERQAGADTDLNPLLACDRITCLTSDHEARAEILRRYRLFSRQPDEMITFMALQRMRPAYFEVDAESGRRALRFDLDPRLYQYGGGYVYLIGAVLGLSGALGLIHLTGEAAVYLEQPELFADFYVLSRAVTLVFGALLLLAVWNLARRAAGRLAGWLAMLLVACTPVFVTGVLEAKPHVPAACMLLWAALSALDYQARGGRRNAMRLGLQAGYAAGLVLTGVVAAAAWIALLAVGRPARRPAATVGRRGAEKRRWAGPLLPAAALAIGVYLLTNPYIPYNALANRAALVSNIANSTAMYAGQTARVGQGALRVAELLYEGCGAGVILVGLVGFGQLLRRRPRETLVAASGGLAMLLICILLGAGKPAEYARFLILPASLLCVAAGVLVAALARRRRGWALGVVAAAMLLAGTPPYMRAFWIDSVGTEESRYLAGRYLHEHVGPDEAVGVLQEPAPYAVPPLDFAQRTVIWLPPVSPLELDEREFPAWLVFTADDVSGYADAWWSEHYLPVARFPRSAFATGQITWANKPVFVYRRPVPAEASAATNRP